MLYSGVYTDHVRINKSTSRIKIAHSDGVISRNGTAKQKLRYDVSHRQCRIHSYRME